MYLFFNEKGILKEIVNDEAIRLGNNDLNHIYIYWENAPEVDSLWVTFTLPSGNQTNELLYPHTKVKKVIPYSKTRDLKYFKDYVSYEFFDINIPNGTNDDGEIEGINVLAEDGLVSATVRCVLTLGQAINTLGLITFNVEKTLVKADYGMNESQFDYLLKHCLLNTTDSLVYRVDDIKSVDITKIPNNAIIVTTNSVNDVEFYKNENGVLVDINHFRYLAYRAGQSEFAERKIYYGTIASPTSLLSTGTQYIGWRVGSQYTFVANGKIYLTDANLTSGSVTINEEIANKLTRLTNLLVDGSMQVRGKIFKGTGTPTENEEVLTRGEIIPLYEEYTNGEIDTLRDELMNYTDDEINALKDDDGKIKSELLPSYVDDVVEYATYDNFPLTGEKGKIYLALDTNNTYRWSGSEYFQLNIKGVEELEKVIPTDIVADGNTIKLYHDNNEITGQNEPVTFKTINGESIIGDDNIVLELSHFTKVIEPQLAVNGYFTEEEVYQLKNHNSKIERNGELYSYSDMSDSEYLTYVHASIDTSKSDVPAVMRAIRINMETYFWSLLDYSLANNNGHYEEMRVGNADNLYSPDSISEELPFVFRPTAGDLNIQNSNAVIRSIRGNTIVWNQLFNINQYIYTATTQNLEVNQATNTIKVTALQDNKETFVIYPQDNITITGHKYYVSLNIKSSSSFKKAYLQINESSSSVYETTHDANTNYLFNDILTASGENQKTILRIDGTFAINDYVEFKDYIIIDLTLMFGAGNEPATVEEFKAMFPNLTYGYTKGELRNVNISGLNSVGLNAFDGMLESGEIYTNGEPGSKSTAIRTTNYIKVIPNKEYVLYIGNWGEYTNLYVQSYDINYNSLGRIFGSGNKGNIYSFTLDNNVSYIKIHFLNTSVSKLEIPTDPQICVHLAHSGYLNGVYKPYESHYLAINTSQYFPDGMKRAVNAFDELTPDTAIKRIGSVDLGTLLPYDLTTTGIVKYRKTQIPSMGAPYSAISNLLIAGYTTTSLKNVNDMVEDLTIGASDTNEYQGLYIYNSSFAGKTKAEIQQALNGVIVYFELLDYEITSTPKQTWEYPADDFGTEEFIQVGNTAPTSHLTIYTPNLRDDVRTLPTNYISVNSFASFASALASALGITITSTWNTTTKQYDFTVKKN